MCGALSDFVYFCMWITEWCLPFTLPPSLMKRTLESRISLFLLPVNFSRHFLRFLEWCFSDRYLRRQWFHRNFFTDKLFDFANVIQFGFCSKRNRLPFLERTACATYPVNI